jgi:hypothetical protein
MSVFMIRGEFLARCFLRLIHVDSQCQSLYNLGSSLWSVDKDTLRLLHVHALLENGDKDNEIEDMLNKVCIRLM